MLLLRCFGQLFALQKPFFCMSDKPFTLDRTVRLVITIAVIVLLFLITRQLSGVLLPFVVSWFLAYLIHPFVNFFQYKLRFKNRTLSVLTALVVLFLILTGLVVILAQPVSKEFSKLYALMSAYLGGLNAETLLPLAWQENLREWLRQIDLQAWLTGANLSAVLSKLLTYAGGIVGGGISVVKSLFVVFICLLYLVFILIDYERISNGFVDIVPPKYRAFASGLLTDLETGMSKYFRGQAVIASCVGVLFALGFVIMRLPLAIVVGLFIGLLNMIPYMQALGIPICMLLGLLQSAYTGTSYWVILLEIAAVFCIVQAIQEALLNPLIMGKTMGMNPAVMLLSLSIFGSLFGIAGMIIALPLTTLLISYYKRFVLAGESFATPPPTPPSPDSEPAPKPAQEGE